MEKCRIYCIFVVVDIIAIIVFVDVIVDVTDIVVINSIFFCYSYTLIYHCY